MTISVILLTGKKLELSKKIKDEPPVEPSFKVVILSLKYTLYMLFLMMYYLSHILLQLVSCFDFKPYPFLLFLPCSWYALVLKSCES